MSPVAISWSVTDDLVAVSNPAIAALREAHARAAAPPKTPPLAHASFEGPPTAASAASSAPQSPRLPPFMHGVVSSAAVGSAAATPPSPRLLASAVPALAAPRPAGSLLGLASAAAPPAASAAGGTVTSAAAARAAEMHPTAGAGVASTPATPASLLSDAPASHELRITRCSRLRSGCLLTAS